MTQPFKDDNAGENEEQENDAREIGEMSGLTRSEAALLRLGRLLLREGYHFVTPTPETHRRVNARRGAGSATELRDVFGWSRPFSASLLSTAMLFELRSANALDGIDGLFQSRVRFSSLGTGLFVHSAYPTVAEDAVFFGPDTYRFARLIDEEVTRGAPASFIVDIGCGSGAGGIVAAKALGAEPKRVVLADVSRQAASFARVNAALNGIPAEAVVSDVLAKVEGAPDLILANPPYLVDAGQRLYRDGGGRLGFDLSLRIMREAVDRLGPGGRLILYTGSPIVRGEDYFREAAEAILRSGNLRWSYREIDPDVFGEELETPAYLSADRIAVVALIVTK